MRWRSAGRIVLLACAILSLVSAVWWGLIRVGWALPAGRDSGPLLHGPLMIGGFLGTLIGLERAIALGRHWAYLAPALTGAGALLALSTYPLPLGPLLLALGSCVFFVVALAVVQRQLAAFTLTLALGALCGLVGNLRWVLGAPVADVVPWWMGFLVLTIAGERLELSRVVQLRRRHYAGFGGCALLLVGGMLITLVDDAYGMRMTGLALLGLAIWLGRCDIARKTVRRTGLTRFIAVALLTGYVWLGLGGLLALIMGGARAGLLYDAALHAVFVGFVVSMIFGHAPIVFPAVLGIPLPYSPACYLPLAVLHGSLAMRVAGDLLLLADLRRAGALLNGIALLLFFANTVRLGLSARRTPAGQLRPARRQGGSGDAGAPR